MGGGGVCKALVSHGTFQSFLEGFIKNFCVNDDYYQMSARRHISTNQNQSCPPEGTHHLPINISHFPGDKIDKHTLFYEN